MLGVYWRHRPSEVSYDQWGFRRQLKSISCHFGRCVPIDMHGGDERLTPLIDVIGGRLHKRENVGIRKSERKHLKLYTLHLRSSHHHQFSFSLHTSYCRYSVISLRAFFCKDGSSRFSVCVCSLQFLHTRSIRH